MNNIFSIFKKKNNLELSKSFQEAFFSGNNSKALKYIDKLISNDPKYNNNYALRGSCYKNLQKYEESIRDFSTYIKNLDVKDIANQIAGLVNRGDSFMFSGNYDAAISDYDKAIFYGENGHTNSEDIINAHFQRGMIFEKLKKLNEALSDFIIVTERKPRNPNYKLALGQIYLSLGQQKEDNELIEKAIEIYKCILTDIDKNYYHAYFKIGLAYKVLNNFDLALDSFLKAEKSGLSNTQLYFNKGYSFYKLNKFKESTLEFKKAIKYDPKNTAAYLYLEMAERQSS